MFRRFAEWLDDYLFRWKHWFVGGKWIAQPIDCERCFKPHVSVHPDCCERVECPYCGCMTQCPPVMEEFEDD